MYNCYQLEPTPNEFCTIWTMMHQVSWISAKECFKIVEVRVLRLCHSRYGTQQKHIQPLVRDVKVYKLHNIGKHWGSCRKCNDAGGTVGSWKCICPNCKNIFVQIVQMYLSKWQNIFVHVENIFVQIVKIYLSKLQTTIYLSKLNVNDVMTMVGTVGSWK